MSVEILDRVEQAFLDVGGGDALDGVAELFGDQLGGIGIDHVGDLVHRALFHQQANNVDRAFRHAVGEFLDVDGFRDDDFADQLFLRLVRRMALQALGAAAERGDRTLAHVVGGERGDQRQAATLLLRRGLGGGLGSHHGTGNAAGAPADLARTFVLVAGVGGDARRARRRSGGCRACRGCRTRGGRGAGLGLAKTLLGFEFGLALGFFVLPVALFFGLAAGFGGFALGLFDAFLAVAALGFLFRQTPLLVVADLGVGERAGAGGAFILGQRAQHHAGIVAWRSWRAGGTGERRPGGRGLSHRWLRRAGSFGCRRVAGETALAALFHQNLLGAAMAEALAHGARLDARLQRQGLARDTQCFVARRFGINHSAVLISLRRTSPRGLYRRILSSVLGRWAFVLVIIRRPVSDQDLAARQEPFARWAREQGSMYHI